MPISIPDSYLPGGTQFVNGNGVAPGDPTSDAASNRQTVIDGTPARVAAFGLVSLAILVGLRWSGFKFNVTAGN